MRLFGGRILLGMERPHRQPAKAQPAQQRPHRPLGQRHTQALFDHPRQVDPAPANHAVRPGSDPGVPIPPPAPAALASAARSAPARADPTSPSGPPRCTDAPSPAASGDPCRRPAPPPSATDPPEPAPRQGSAALRSHPCSATHNGEDLPRPNPPVRSPPPSKPPSKSPRRSTESRPHLHRKPPRVRERGRWSQAAPPSHRLAEA